MVAVVVVVDEVVLLEGTCRLGVGLLGLNDPDAFLGSCEPVCFLRSANVSQL